MKFYLKDFCIFINVAETESLSKTAMMMGLSISSVSKRLSRLEEYLNTTLFERNTRSVKLSPLGEQAYIKSKEITQIFSDFIDEIRIGGVSRLNVSHNYNGSLIPLVDWIYSYSSENENHSFYIHSNFSKKTEDALLISDLMITTERSKWPMAIHRKLIKVNRKIHINPKLNTDTYTDPYDINKSNIVFYSPNSNEKLMLTNRVNNEKLKIEASMNTDDINTVLKLLGEKKVIAFGLPEYVTTNLCRDGILQEVMTEWLIEPIQYYIIWKGRKSYRNEFTEFINFLENRLNQFFSP